MIKARIQVEEMHVYYFIAKKFIGYAKLGLFGIVSIEEKLLKKLYNCLSNDDVQDIVRQLSNKLEEKQEKIDRVLIDADAMHEVIKESVNCVKNLNYQAIVLNNVTKFLKNDFTTSQKITLCIEKIVQAKRVLEGLSPSDRQILLSGVRFDFKKDSNIKMIVTAVDAENIRNKKTALVDDVTGNKIFASNVLKCATNKNDSGNIISNNISTDLKIDISYLEDGKDNLKNTKLLDNTNDIEVLEELDSELSENYMVPCVSADKVSLEDKAENEVNLKAEEKEGGNPLQHYLIGATFDDNDLEYNIPIVEPSYDIVDGNKIGDARYSGIYNKYNSCCLDDSLEYNIPIVEPDFLDDFTVADVVADEVVNKVRGMKNSSIMDSKNDVIQKKQPDSLNSLYDEPVIFKVIEENEDSIE